MQEKIDKELQYWKIKQGSHPPAPSSSLPSPKTDKTQSAPSLLETVKVVTATTNHREQLERLLSSVPAVDCNVSSKSLEQWKKMKPLTIEEI